MKPWVEGKLHRWPDAQKAEVGVLGIKKASEFDRDHRARHPQDDAPRVCNPRIADRAGFGGSWKLTPVGKEIGRMDIRH